MDTNKCNCQQDPKADSCDIVQYAEDLVAADAKNVTTGEQVGFDKVSVEGVLTERQQQQEEKE